MLNQSKNHRSTPPCTHHMNVKMKILTLQLLHLNLPAPHVLVSVKTWGMDKIGKVLWQTNHGKKRNLWDKVKKSTLISGHHLYQQLWLDSGFVQTWEAHRSYKMLWDVVGFDKLHDFMILIISWLILIDPCLPLINHERAGSLNWVADKLSTGQGPGPTWERSCFP